jgi:sodium/hydrogen antiporter
LDALAVSIVLVTIIVWCAVASRFAGTVLTAPIFFVASGFVYAEVVGVLDLEPHYEPVKLLAEVTLVWVLFADASGVNLRDFRSDLGTQARLLGVGLPLTVGLGTLLAVSLLGLDPWAALLVGAALAPTDAALGSAVVTNRQVPAHLRRALGVESGLNDGIVTPVVLLALAGVAATNGIQGVPAPERAAVDLVVGVVVGTSVGIGGGGLMRSAHRRGWLSEDIAGVAVLALALLAYSGALVLGANGFVAAFVGGLLFGHVSGSGGAREIAYVEETASLASMMAWLVLGALAFPTLMEWADWRVVCYALMSLTFVRMVPVTLAMLGARLSWAEVAFIGWFGPRGLASVVFALLALESLGEQAVEPVASITLTVVLSVVLHGMSAGPLAARLAARVGARTSRAGDAR